MSHTAGTHLRHGGCAPAIGAAAAVLVVNNGKVVTQLRIGRLICTTAASVALLGTATGVARAEQVSVPDVARTLVTVDGWQMALSLTDARIDAVPNMASAPLSKEGFLSGRVTLRVEGDGTAAVNGGQVVVGAQLGCQVNLDDGVDLGAGLDADLFDELPVVGLGPDIGATLRSGGITAVGFGVKELKGRVATINIVDAHVQVDECGGVVTVRLFASAQMSTDISDDSVSVYSAVLPL